MITTDCINNPKNDNRKIGEEESQLRFYQGLPNATISQPLNTPQ